VRFGNKTAHNDGQTTWFGNATNCLHDKTSLNKNALTGFALLQVKRMRLSEAVFLPAEQQMAIDECVIFAVIRLGFKSHTVKYENYDSKLRIFQII
jgi:hypothetical protein